MEQPQLFGFESFVRHLDLALAQRRYLCDHMRSLNHRMSLDRSYKSILVNGFAAESVPVRLCSKVKSLSEQTAFCCALYTMAPSDVADSFNSEASIQGGGSGESHMDLQPDVIGNDLANAPFGAPRTEEGLWSQDTEQPRRAVHGAVVVREQHKCK